MTQAAKTTSLLVFGTLLLVELFYLNVRLERYKTDRPVQQTLMYVPQGYQLRLASLGYNQVVADFLWIRSVQAIGAKTVPPEVGPWLVHTLDVITTLDPHFTDAYELGSLALATVFPLYKESNQLLEKGEIYNPNVWRLPFLAGVTYYFNLWDDEKAAEQFAKAARLPGAPDYLAPLAARLFVSARNPQSALDFLAAMASQTASPNMKMALVQRMKEVTVERDLVLLEQAIRRYRESFGNAPRQLADLVEARLLKSIPVEPFGGRYLYDVRTGSVRSSEMKERLAVYGKRGNRV